VSIERPGQTPDHKEPDLDQIEGFRAVRRISRGRRRLLGVSRAPRPVGQLSDSEIEGWAGQLVDDMAEGISHERSRTPRA